LSKIIAVIIEFMRE